MTNEELASLIQEGNTALLPSLWEQVERFTAAKAKDYFSLHPLTCSASGVTLEDLQQEAYFALLDAVRYYDPEAGHTFLTYMRYPLQNAFNALCGRRTQKSKQAPLNHSKSLYTPIGEEDITLADTLEDESAAEDFQQAEAAIYHRQLHNALEECLSTLPEIQEAADGACQCAHCYKDYGKPTNKSQRPQQGLSCSAFSTARKIGDIDGKHREQAR